MEAPGAAKALLTAGEWEEAFKAYESILAKAPDSAVAHAAYDAALAKRHPAEAEARYRGAFQLEPTNPASPFGAHDGRTRHVSVSLQGLIIGLFFEHDGDEWMANALQNGDAHERVAAQGFVSAAIQPSA